MALWDEHQMEARIVEVLDAVPLANPGGHHFGRPFMTAYQIAIELDRRWGLAAATGKAVGGRGSGADDSLARYVANQLSRRIKADPAYVVEGGFLSNVDVDVLRYRGADGGTVTSSATGLDLSMYRLRP